MEASSWSSLFCQSSISYIVQHLTGSLAAGLHEPVSNKQTKLNKQTEQKHITTTTSKDQFPS